jgi:DNA-binding beta-propeller fold protein YncE
LKKSIPDIWVAVVILVVLGGVFLMYGRGLLGGAHKEEGGSGPKGGGPPAPPPRGVPQVTIDTIAGAPEAGYLDGPGAQARFSGPSAIAVAPDGAIYVADSRNHRIRAIARDGATTTIAGSGPAGTIVGGFADGPADAARLSCPSGVAVGADGAVYFSDAGNHRVRVIRAGRVSTLAGGDTPPDSEGIPTGGYADGPGAAARFCFPAGICIGPDGALIVADPGNHCLRRVALDGATTTLVASGGQLVSPTNVRLRADSSLLIADPAAGLFSFAGGKLTRIPGAEVVTAPAGACEGSGGAIIICCANKESLFRLAPPAPAQLWAGMIGFSEEGGRADGTGAMARFCTPSDLVRAPDGTILIADFGNSRVCRMSPG